MIVAAAAHGGKGWYSTKFSRIHFINVIVFVNAETTCQVAKGKSHQKAQWATEC